MARTKHTLTTLFAGLLAPVTDAVYAETGKRLTRPAWGRVARALLAAGLRALADAVEPAPAKRAAPRQARPAPTPDLVTAPPVVLADVKPAPVPVPVVEAARVEPAAQPAPAPVATVARKPRPAKAKAAPAAARNTRKPRATAPAKPKKKGPARRKSATATT